MRKSHGCVIICLKLLHLALTTDSFKLLSCSCADFVSKGQLGKDEESLAAVVFASRPASGGAILKLQDL